MRKLLLTTAAAFGLIAVYNGANAQQGPDAVPQSPDAGQSTTSAFGGAVVSPTTQAPGTLIVRLNGRVYTQGGILNVQNANGTYYYNPSTGASSEVPFVAGVTNATVGGQPVALPQYFGTAAQATAQGFRPTGPTQNVVVVPGNPQTNKLGHNGIYSYFRLYPGVDGVAANGLMYGAGVEIRQDGNWPSGQGASGSISALNARQGLLYVRRAWGYVGTKNLGIVRVGGTDGPSDLFMVGNNENFGDGGWNGSSAAYLPTQLWIYWPFADSGNLYGHQKAVYLSPAFAGFDFGASFAPTTAGTQGAAANQGCNAPNAFTSAGPNGSFANGPAVAGVGCAQLSSTTTGDYTRPRNMYDIGARYRGLFGPIGFAAYVDYIGSGKIADNVVAPHSPVDGYSIGSGGAQITYGGLTIGGMANGGRYNGAGGFNLAPSGGADEVAVEFGGSYTYGPFVVGTHLFQTWSAGSSGPAVVNGITTGVLQSVGQRREQGIAVGGTYSVAPGLALNLTYIWGERKESGYDFLTGTTSYPVTAASALNTTGCGAASATATAACLHNKVTSSGIMLGAQVTW